MNPETRRDSSGCQSKARHWLTNEDSKCFDERLGRLTWLAEHTPEGEYWTFPGGFLAKSSFEEMRYSFAYAQYLATILIGLAFIERTLSAVFYGWGRDDLQRANLSTLLDEALDSNVISKDEHKELSEIRKLRNSYAHFRKPGHSQGVEYRATNEDVAFYDIVERDAITVLAAALRLVDKRLFNHFGLLN